MSIDIGGKEFLIVDDYADMRGVLRNMLQSFGAIKIESVSNGKDAISKMESKRYDVVLCDYNLGRGRDGQQVLEEVRHRDLIGVGALFVMVTAENTREMVMGAVEYEPDSYLTKPFTKDLLSQRLSRLIHKKMKLMDVQNAVINKEYENAIDLLDQKIIDDPNGTKDFIRLKGDLLMKSGVFDKAEELYNEVLSEREIGWARIGLGKTYFAAEKYQDAKVIFEELIQENEGLMAGYDWLAKTHQEMGDKEEAQKVLERAAALSPKATLRQRNLGDLAQRNGDDEIAEKAYEVAIQKGKHSIYKHPAIFANLARSKAKIRSGDEGLKVLRNLRKEFPGNSESVLFAAMTETVVHHDMGNVERAEKSMEEADGLFSSLGSKASPLVAMGMARACGKLGDQERATKILRDAVRNNHEEKALLRDIGSTMGELGLDDDPESMIADIKKDIVRLNNKGVELARVGKLDEAVELFGEAADTMPGNKVVNLNAARVLMMHLENSKDVNHEEIGKVREYLERVNRMDSENPTLRKMQRRFNKLQKSTQ